MSWNQGGHSTNQIPLVHIRLCSITCHLLVNNLHFITYSNRIIQPHWKKFTWNLMLLIAAFSRNSPAFWLFLQIKFAFSCVGPNPLRVNSLWTTCFFSRFSRPGGKVQKGNDQSRRPLWIIILFSRLVNLYLFEIAIYSWLGSIGDTKEFQVAFRCKITWNDIFVVSVVSSATATQRALSPTGNIGRYVTRPNNGYEGDYSERGTDVFYFCS